MAKSPFWKSSKWKINCRSGKKKKILYYNYLLKLIVIVKNMIASNLWASWKVVWEPRVGKKHARFSFCSFALSGYVEILEISPNIRQVWMNYLSSSSEVFRNPPTTYRQRSVGSLYPFKVSPTLSIHSFRYLPPLYHLRIFHFVFILPLSPSYLSNTGRVAFFTYVLFFKNKLVRKRTFIMTLIFFSVLLFYFFLKTLFWSRHYGTF